MCPFTLIFNLVTQRVFAFYLFFFMHMFGVRSVTHHSSFKSFCLPDKWKRSWNVGVARHQPELLFPPDLGLSTGSETSRHRAGNLFLIFLRKYFILRALSGEKPEERVLSPKLFIWKLKSGKKQLNSPHRWFVSYLCNLTESSSLAHSDFSHVLECRRH